MIFISSASSAVNTKLPKQDDCRIAADIRDRLTSSHKNRIIQAYLICLYRDLL